MCLCLQPQARTVSFTFWRDLERKADWWGQRKHLVYWFTYSITLNTGLVYSLRHPRKASPWARMAFCCVHRGRPQMIVYYVRSQILYQKQWRFGIFWSLDFFRSYWFSFYITCVCVCTCAHVYVRIWCMGEDTEVSFNSWSWVWNLGHQAWQRYLSLPTAPSDQLLFSLGSWWLATLFIIMPLSRSEEDLPPWYTRPFYKEMWHSSWLYVNLGQDWVQLCHMAGPKNALRILVCFWVQYCDKRLCFRW